MRNIYLILKHIKKYRIFHGNISGADIVANNLCEFSMVLEKKEKYLSFFPVIKKKNYKKTTKNTIKLDKNATKCYNNTNERKKPFLLLVQRSTI